MNVLVVNAGSTSLKLSVVSPDGATETVQSVGDAGRSGVGAVGHRVVHGGARFTGPVVIDDAVKRELADLSCLAPLHTAPALAGIDRAERELTDVPHVAVFDTAFHASLRTEAAEYAVPARWRDLGVRRYGFHGLSVAWAAERVRERRLVVCHLGGGSSVTAVLEGRSVDTTMGFSPLEGVPMATRSGSLDPGILIYLLRECGVSSEEVHHALERESGLKGLSGLSGHVRELEQAEAEGHEGAALALGVYVHRIAAAVSAMTASLGGLDALAFTAGAGERSRLVRARVCARLGFLGVELDATANESLEGEGDVSPAGATVRVAVVQAREDLVIAREVRRLLRYKT
ncbi:MAG: acetate/propionate family kinase [Actinobacteria bacterium]|nr:acetate/propionate family kinase [Actinomycetota bacterium]